MHARRKGFMLNRLIKHTLLFLGCASTGVLPLSAQLPLYTKWQSYAGSYLGTTDVTYAVTLDPATNLYFSGTAFYGNIDNIQGITPDTSYYNDDTGADNIAYIAKANAQGQLLWNITAGIGNHSAIQALLETNGVVYAVGQFFQLERYNEPNPQSDAVLLKLNAETGAPLWGEDDLYTYTRFLVNETSAVTNRYNTQNAFRALALDGNQNIYAAGYTTMSNLSLTGSTAYRGNQDGVVAKYSASGVCQWIRYLGGSGKEQVNGIAVGPDNAIYVVGETQSTNWISASGLNPFIYKCGFLVKLDAQGTLISQLLFGASNGGSYLTAVKREATSGRVWLVGSTSSSNLCRSALNSFSGTWDGYVMNLTDQGNSFTTNWCRYVGGSTNDEITALSLLPGTRALIGGITFSSSWLESTTASTHSAGNADGFLMQLDQLGTPLWANYQGGLRDDRIAGLSALSEACIATVGRTWSLPAPESTWLFGGFNSEWAKSSDWGTSTNYSANMSYGFVGIMTTIPGEPPSITHDLNNVTLYEGESATFSLSATGFAPLLYTWYHNTDRIPETQTNVYTTAALLPSNNNDTYFCIVSNYYGMATSQTARVTVIANGTVMIAITNGPSTARWTIDNGTTWQTSGTTLALRPGNMTVLFNTIDGWISPASTSLTLAAGATLQHAVGYIPLVATAFRTLTDYTNVSLSVMAPAGVTNWVLTESIPANMTPHATVGSWDSTNRTLTFTALQGTSLTYQLAVTNNGIYTLAGNIQSQPSGISNAVTGDDQVIRADFYRTIVGTNVYITVSDSFTNRNFTLLESLPQGLSVVPGSISPAGGEYYSAENEVEWYRIRAKTFHYTVMGLPGSYTVNGLATIGSTPYVVLGADTITISEPLPPEIPPVPNIVYFVPLEASFALTFTSLVNQAYIIQTNANGLKDSQGALVWGSYKNVQGTGPLTQETVERMGSNMFFRIVIPE